MSFQAKIIADSISQEGQRLTTLQLAYPRYIHAELLTHRAFSRSAGSSRAVPVAKMAQIAMSEMVEPIYYGLNQSGMQASDLCIEGSDLEEAKAIWRSMAETCAKGAQRLAEIGLHKQWANRPLEWFSNIRVIVTATEWDNFFELRAHPDAQPEIQALAYLMQEKMEASPPREMKRGDWHLPYVQPHEFADYGDDVELLKKVSAARCCRVSYMKHDGTHANIEEDLALCNRLVGSRPLHASPFEHQATPDQWNVQRGGGFGWDYPHLHGNFNGWIQHRKEVELEVWNKGV